MEVDSNEFRHAMGRFPTGIAVITVADGGKIHGMTANSLTSVSLQPPVILICVDQHAKCRNLIQKAGLFGVNILKENQMEISRLFARQPIEKDVEVTFRRAAKGAAVLDGALAHLICETIEEVEVGDHTVFFGKVIETSAGEGRPLGFFRGRYVTVN
ncbi:flavin reductase family protein [Kyrpidia sp.]|uniref:flavin reductase family protein n=1 Tax=Kyrpidia sp. TaxID=2073077 RepID=UPI00258E538B|nr:flavin reductase family protein [Kyrpidia sp.]MCL6577443.1 flavin reductase family protein [Kyrpidia sp.]